MCGQAPMQEKAHLPAELKTLALTDTRGSKGSMPDDFDTNPTMFIKRNFQSLVNTAHTLFEKILSKSEGLSTIQELESAFVQSKNKLSPLSDAEQFTSTQV